jgi:hypothetical protein
MQDIVDANIDSQNKNIIFAVDWKCACYVKNATGGLDVQVMGTFLLINRLCSQNETSFIDES